jgi:putative acyl-CoA dehydrogenase
MSRARKLLADPATAEAGARAILESIAVAVQGSLMKRHADAAAAEAFCAARVDPSGGGLAFGTLARDGAGLAALVERAQLQN